MLNCEQWTAATGNCQVENETVCRGTLRDGIARISLHAVRSSKLVRRSAIALDVGIFEKIARLLEALGVGQNLRVIAPVNLVREAAVRKCQRHAVERLAAGFED